MRCAPFCNNNFAISTLLFVHARAKGDRPCCGDVRLLKKTKRKEISKFLKKKKKKKRIQIDYELH